MGVLSPLTVPLEWRELPNHTQKNACVTVLTCIFYFQQKLSIGCVLRWPVSLQWTLTCRLNNLTCSIFKLGHKSRVSCPVFASEAKNIPFIGISLNPTMLMKSVPFCVQRVCQYVFVLEEGCKISTYRSGFAVSRKVWAQFYWPFLFLVLRTIYPIFTSLT